MRPMQAQVSIHFQVQLNEGRASGFACADVVHIFDQGVICRNVTDASSSLLGEFTVHQLAE